ncbi:hypothetical protein GC197_00695 [bacterium]|nr:hypothetical protein [bacterium]
MQTTTRQSRNCLRQPAFTLVELLVVMGVLVLMSSMVLVGLASAAETARVNRTRSQITKIHALVMERYDSFRYRRIEPLSSNDLTGALTGSARIRARYRVDRIRELMRMEMPCHKVDLAYDSTINPKSSTTALWNRYRNAISRRSKTSDFAGWSPEYENSECLYMILESMQDGEANGLDFLKPSEIGDTDNDGIPEVLDAWGTPISYVLWAPGFYGPRSNLHKKDAPDPFDPLGVREGKTVDMNGFYVHYPLFPLIFSAGPDREYDIATSLGGSADQQISPSSSTDAPNNPYFVDTTTTWSSSYLGTEGDFNGNGSEEYLDNITNHDLVISGNDK